MEAKDVKEFAVEYKGRRYIAGPRHKMPDLVPSAHKVMACDNNCGYGVVLSPDGIALTLAGRKAICHDCFKALGGELPEVESKDA